MKTDFPSLEYLYRKLDNAGCYAENGEVGSSYFAMTTMNPKWEKTTVTEIVPRYLPTKL